jgi:hypothetical protein
MSRHTKNEMSSHSHPTNRPALLFHNIFSIDPIPQMRRPCQVRNSKVLICMNSAVQEGNCHSPRAGRNCSITSFQEEYRRARRHSYVQVPTQWQTPNATPEPTIVPSIEQPQIKQENNSPASSPQAPTRPKREYIELTEHRKTSFLKITQQRNVQCRLYLSPSSIRERSRL